MSKASLADMEMRNTWMLDPSAARARLPDCDRLPNLRHLHVFQLTARLSSVSQAASVANLSQPAVTQAIAQLELLADAALFDRRPTGCYLTPAGEIFLVRVDRMFAQFEDALRAPLVGPAFIDPTNDTAVWRLTATQVRNLIAIAEFGTFEEAVRALGITRTSLHRAAREIEAQLRLTLFERAAHGWTPTLAASELARRLRVAIAEIPQAVEEIAIAKGQAAVRITIGLVPMAPALILTTALYKLTEAYPGLTVKISEGPYTRLLTDLRNGQIDILFGVLRRPDWATDVREEPLLQDPYAVVARRGHALTRKRQVTLDDLAAYDWVVPEQGAPRRKAFERLFEGAAVRPTVTIETSSSTLQRVILATSDRITLLTRQEVALEQTAGRLVALNFVPNIARRPDGVALRADWRPTSMQRHFIELLRASARRLGTAEIGQHPHDQSAA